MAPGSIRQLVSDGREQRLELGGEDDPVSPAQVQQRLDAQRVAGQRQLAGLRVGYREREHAPEPLQCAWAPSAARPRARPRCLRS